GVSAAFGGSRGVFSGTPRPDLGPEAESDPELLRASSPEVSRRLRGLAVVRGGFVSEEEAAELLREVEPALRRGRYQSDHWDRVRGVTGGCFLRGFGVTLGCFGLPSSAAAPSRGSLCSRPRCCGSAASGTPGTTWSCCCSRGPSTVLRLRSLRAPRDHLELLLQPRSLYVLRGAARFEFTHEILGEQESFFGGLRVPRGRRVALI
ncbi:ALKB7 dioxygenase, partial [Motacilla alba]|nr:ALKB7 dioxygenase [Motacilla alba]